MTVTVKEEGLLKDLKNQEQLCIGKYKKYAEEAKASELKALFTEMASVEETHLKTVNDILAGNVPTVPEKIENSNNKNTGKVTYENESDKQADAFLCRDMLSTEKHASALYDTSVFEFTAPNARKVLNHIQAEEQQHGEQLYSYMNANGMYC